jgi:hypothetical protein
MLGVPPMSTSEDVCDGCTSGATHGRPLGWRAHAYLSTLAGPVPYATRRQEAWMSSASLSSCGGRCAPPAAHEGPAMLEADSHLNFERQQKLGLKGTFVGAVVPAPIARLSSVINPRALAIQMPPSRRACPPCTGSPHSLRQHGRASSNLSSSLSSRSGHSKSPLASSMAVSAGSINRLAQARQWRRVGGRQQQQRQLMQQKRPLQVHARLLDGGGRGRRQQANAGGRQRRRVGSPTDSRPQRQLKQQKPPLLIPALLLDGGGRGQHG